MLVEKSVIDFLEELASRAPVPGGGSVAALSASLASGLTEMVANLTLGRKGYENTEVEMKRIILESSVYRKKFLNNIDKDADAFNLVMKAFKMPKNTPEEKAGRKEAIQKKMKNAALVPLEVAKDTLKLMEFISEVVEKGNKNALSDGAVASMMARTAVLSALYNVKINLQSIKDENFVKEISLQVKEIELNAIEYEKEILLKVDL
ncbi:MAG: cyclodeaminase/cyclohydrolase family protein [Candidatus Caldatribacteriota bacterium]|nr:cyclodeaminase/cyclohydrolase family protein [Candidatus Caldatribacteriota bacterium]